MLVVVTLVFAAGGASGAAAQPYPEHGPRSGSRRLVWNESWPRVRPWEYVATGTSYLGVLALELSGRPTTANWTGDFLFDFAGRDALGSRAPAAVSAWTLVGDIPFYTAMAFPALDALLVAGAIRGSWDVAWQMVAMDLEAFAVALPLVYVTQYFLRRERPYSKYCNAPGGAPFACSGSNFTQSFPSGHVALVATSAGLACAHHSRLPIYGGGAADIMACLTWSGAAILTGIARIAINKHYISDVVAGLGIGAFAGYGVPVLLHYAMRSDEDDYEYDYAGRRRRGARTASSGPGFRFLVMPIATQRSLGIGAAGAF